MAKPENIRFYGTTKAEKLASRSHDGFRLTFSGVAGALQHEFEVKENGLTGTILEGMIVPFSMTNTVYSVRIRASLNSGGYSDWSDYFVSMTRPPPNDLARLPYDLQGWGVVLSWTRPVLAYDYDVELKRENADGTWIRSFGPTSEPQYTDAEYILNQLNVYTTIVAVSSPPVPLPYGEDHNRSFPSDPIEATGPMSHSGHAVQKVLKNSISLNEIVLRNLLVGD